MLRNQSKEKAYQREDAERALRYWRAELQRVKETMEQARQKMRTIELRKKEIEGFLEWVYDKKKER